MQERPSPIYDFAISIIDEKPRTCSEITRNASKHFKRNITDGSISRALRKAQERGISRRLDDLKWVSVEEWEAAQRRKADPQTIKATKIPSTTKTSSTGLIPALSRPSRSNSESTDRV